MISLGIVSFYWFGRSPILPLRCAKSSLEVYDGRLMISINVYSSGETTIGCTWSPGVSEKLKISFSEDTTYGLLSSLLFLFSFFLFSPILGHKSVLCYFISGGVYSQTQIRFLHSGYIIFKYHLLFLQYHHTFYFYLLTRDDGLLPRSFICCSLEVNDIWLLLTALFL